MKSSLNITDGSPTAIAELIANGKIGDEVKVKFTYSDYNFSKEQLQKIRATRNLVFRLESDFSIVLDGLSSEVPEEILPYIEEPEAVEEVMEGPEVEVPAGSVPF